MKIKQTEMPKEDETYLRKVKGSLSEVEHPRWGEIEGDINKQTDVISLVSGFDDKINKEAEIRKNEDLDLLNKIESVDKILSEDIAKEVSDRKEDIATVNLRVTNLENSIPPRLDALKQEIEQEIEPKLEQVKRDVEETIKPKLIELDEAKAEALWYDEYSQAGDKQYWYVITDASKAHEEYDVVKEYFICDSEGNPIPYNFGKGGGGGGDDDTVVKVTLVYWPTTIAYGTKCELIVKWTSLKDEVPTGPGTIQVLVDGELKLTKTNIPQGNVTLDVSDFIDSGTHKVEVRAIDSYDTQGRLVSTITAVDIRIESSFNYNRVFVNTISYNYIPYGDITKVVHFILDDEDVAQDVVVTSGEERTHIFSFLTHGSHTLTVYFECEIDGNIVRSNELFYDLIFEVKGDPTPIIASEFTDLEQEQFVSFFIPFRVYTPNHNLSDIQLIVNGEVIQELSVNQDIQVWEYKTDTIGDKIMTIKCGDIEKTFNVHVHESEINVQPITESLGLYLNTIGRSNSEAHPEIWKDDKYAHISCNLTGFNFASDGWQQDADGNTVLKVSGDARVEIPYKIFSENFVTNLGRTIELEIATSEVRDYETMLMTCWSGERGFFITPQLAKIKSQQSELQTQYKEDDHVRLTFVVEKRDTTHLILMYINGIMSGAIQYPTNDSFRQNDPVNISIGSSDATIDIYNIRVYNMALTRRQVVTNWIADTQSGILKRDRYLHNDNFNDKEQLDINKLPEDLPYMIWDIDPLPQYKGDKRPGNVVFEDKVDESRSFESAGATYNVQGTSSAVYPVKNMKIKYGDGFIRKDGTVDKTFPVFPGQIGAKEFTYKVDYASSEGANNVELVGIYNDGAKAQGIMTPPQKLDDRVRVGVAGFPTIGFQKIKDKLTFISKANWNNDKGNEDVFGLEDGDESWEITNNNTLPALFQEAVTDENWGNSFEARFPDVGDEADITRLKEMTAWVVSTWRDTATDLPLEEPITFEYTEVYLGEDDTYHERTVSKSFDTDSKEYRLTKFKAELKDWFDVDSTIFYYIFTELYLMVDSRAKNAFPTYYASRVPGDGGDRWFWLPYDMDTAIGINNEGALVFDYNLEDTDTVEGAYVFNGQTSVLWCNLRDAFSGEIAKLYSELRSTNLISYDETERRFEEHQNKWSENIFNEDAYVKYIVPLVESGANYLDMLQGSKTEQRRWWLYNRFRYMDSKFNAGSSKSDTIIMRAYAKDDITITPYADIYASVRYGNTSPVSTRAKRGESYVLANPLQAVNDTEYTVYSASQLKSIGDISGSKVGLLDASKAIRLQDLIVGSDADGYTNPNLTNLTLGKNTLLKVLDVRNCINLKQPVDITNCINIEEIYFDNTSITGISLPNGGVLKKLHLPSTLTNLTIKNQPTLEEFVLAGTENVQTLWLENIPSELIDAKAIIMDMPKGSAIRLIGFNQNVETVQEIKDLYDLLDTMTGLNAQGEDVDKAQVNGTIYIPTISYADYVALSARYLDIKIIATITVCTVKFYNDGELYDSQNVNRGSDAERPEDPTKPSTQEHYYVFEGWDKEFTNVQSDLDINAIYSEHLQVYTVKFDLQSTIPEPIDDQYIEYGYCATKPIDPIIEGSTFNGWFTRDGFAFDFNTPIIDDITLYASWTDYTVPIVDISRIKFDEFKYEISDNVAVTKYAVTMTPEIPSEWIDIKPVTPFIGAYEVAESGLYYVWGSDAAEKVNEQRSIRACSIESSVDEGAELVLTEDDDVIDDFVLTGTSVKISVLFDDAHYENLVIKLNGEVIENNLIKIIEEDSVIEVTCNPQTFKVSFDLDEKGEPVDDQYIVYNNLVRRPSNQFIEGYVISGWYTERSYENQWEFDNDRVDHSMTLYAKWDIYVEPSIITVKVEDVKNFNCNLSQTASNGVEIDWGDGSEISTSPITGYLTMSHTYDAEGIYEIKITCVKGSHKLGRSTANRQVITPVNSIIDVEFAWNMTTTGEYAFQNAVNLKTLHLTDYMVEVANGAFYGCSGLTELVIPKNIIKLGDNAFNKCSGLTGTFEFSDNIQSIGSGCFGETGYSEFILYEGISEIGESAFANCTNLNKINIPKSLTSFSDYLLSNTALTMIDVPETVERFGSNVFTACASLTKVILRNPNLIVGETIFGNCYELTTAGPIGGDYNIEFAWDEFIPDYAFQTGSQRFAPKQWLTEITLPSTIKKIGSHVFDNLVITHIELPDGLIEIGDYAFNQCSSLKTALDIPSSVNSIGRNCFEQCRALPKLNIHTNISTNKCDTIDWRWFNGILNIEIHVPQSLDTEELQQDAYGLFWNYNSATGKIIRIISDL